MSQRFDGDVYVGGNAYAGSVFYNNAQKLTTANDTTTKLNSTYLPVLLIGGTGVLQWYNLGDTTEYTDGRPIVIVNGTNEFVGVHSNSATVANATVWERVPPRATLSCYLLDSTVTGGAGGGEKEGTWAISLSDPAGVNPRYGTNIITDFIGPLTGTPFTHYDGGWLGVISGGGRSIITTGDPSGTTGIVDNNASGVASYSLMHSCRGQILGGGARRTVYRASRSDANAASNEFTTRLGYGTNITGGAHVDGVYFLNDFTAYGNFYVCRTIAAAGTNDTFITGDVPSVAPNYDTLAIEVASAGTRVDYWINRELRRTHSTAANIPSGIALPSMFGVTKVANTSTRSLYIDWTQVQQYPITLRG